MEARAADIRRCLLHGVPWATGAADALEFFHPEGIGEGMSAFDDALELVKHAEGDLAKIRKAYEASLHAKEVSGSLQVQIKNFVENLRSALDFAANGLFERYGSSLQAKPKVYFPYATAAQSRAMFESSGRIDVCIPGIGSSRPDIVQSLVEMQHFEVNGHEWLPDFMDLTNENKHERLTPQVRKETKELRISRGGASIGMGEGASITVGSGASISIGGAVIRGGQTFDVDNPPRVEGGKVEKTTWVSFDFESTGRPVIPLLEAALKGTSQIVRELSTK